MTGGSAFCTKCGAVVGETWQSCEACGALQRIEPGAGNAVRPALPPLAGSQPKTKQATPPTATYLAVIGGVLIVVGIILFLVAFGFPPGTTTTYEVTANGTTSESTSPGTLEAILPILLCVVGGVLLRASKVVKSPTGR